MFEVIKNIMKKKKSDDWDSRIYKDTFRFTLFDFEGFDDEMKNEILKSFKNSKEYEICKKLDWGVNFRYNEITIEKLFTFTKLNINHKSDLENFKHTLNNIRRFNNKLKLEEKQTGIKFSINITNYINNIKCIYYDFNDKGSKDINKIEKFEMELDDDFDVIFKSLNTLSLIN